MAAIMLLYIQLDDYLAQWFIHEQGGSVPVRLMRGSVESSILEQFLQTPPADYQPPMDDDSKLAIIIPHFKHKDPAFFHFLPEKAMDMLVGCIRNRFDIDMWTAVHKFQTLMGRKDQAIYAYMENHGIETTETNWNAVAKRYQRKRDLYLSAQRMKKMRKNRTDFKR